MDDVYEDDYEETHIVWKNVEIEIRRSSYWIYGYKLRDSMKLERYLSAYDVFSKKYTHAGFTYDGFNDILKIPHGFKYDKLKALLQSDHIRITKSIDKFYYYPKIKPINHLSINIKPRDDFQYKTVKFLIADKESDAKKSHRLVSLDTGFGKTACTIMALMKLKSPAIITSPNLSQQWLDRIIQYTGAVKEKDVFLLRGLDSIKNMVKSNNNRAVFFVISLDTLMVAVRKEPELIQKFIDKFGIGVHIYDECHTNFLKIVNISVEAIVQRVWLLSATPVRNSYQQDALYSRLFRDNIPSYGNSSHNINKYNILMYRYTTNPSPMDKFRIQLRRGVHSTRYFQYLFRTDYGINLYSYSITYFASKLFHAFKYDKDIKILVYIQSLNGISRIKDKLKKVVLSNGFKFTVGDYTGNVPKNVRKYELDNNIILTTLANRVGLDVPNLVAIINFIPISSTPVIKQLRGRIRVRGGWYIDCFDAGFEKMAAQRDIRLRNHKKNAIQIAFYEHINGKIVKV